MNGKELKDWRIKRKMTAKELAELSGVTASTISRFENGQGCNIKNYEKLMNVMDFDKVAFNEEIPLRSKVSLYIKEIQVLLESEDSE